LDAVSPFSFLSGGGEWGRLEVGEASGSVGGSASSAGGERGGRITVDSTMTEDLGMLD